MHQCWDRLHHPQWCKSEIHDSGALQCGTFRMCLPLDQPSMWLLWTVLAPTRCTDTTLLPVFSLRETSGRLGEASSWAPPALHTSGKRERLITREALRTSPTSWGDFPSLDRSQRRGPGDSISKRNENCQAWTCLKRRTLFTTHKHWLGASSKALSLQTPFIKGLSGVCLLLFTLPLCRRGPEPFQINQSNTPLWS